VSTETHHIRISGLLIEVVRKKIKNLHLGVYPPAGRVRVAAPLHVTDEAVRLAVITRLAWIKRQRAKFEKQERQSDREYVTGESHYFQGRRYRLNVVYQKGRAHVVVRNKSTIDLFVREGSTTAQREKVFIEWYRQQLKAIIPPLIEKWERIIRVTVTDWRVKAMKTRWGSCSVHAGRIWLNLELVKKPQQCLEYVIVHEIVHIIEKSHNDRFASLMDSFMPQWRLHRDELNRSALRHETWDS
jgi:predicted metal-dependent hydrolase